MDFLKKNWAKIITIALALTGAVLVLIPIFMVSKLEFYQVCQSLGIILFFVGIAATACLKMSDKTKKHAKYVTLCASLLVLIVMSIGLGGFCKDKDKAQGALGKAYAIYKSVPDDIKAGQAKITAGETAIANLTPLATGFGAAATQLGAAAGTTTLTALKAGGANEAALVAGFVAAGFGEEATTTVAVAAAITGTTLKLAQDQVADGKAQLPIDIKATKQDAKAGAFTVLFIYISTILAFGLIPTVRVTKKLVTKEVVAKA